MTRIIPTWPAIAMVCSLGTMQAPQPVDAGTLTITSTSANGTRVSTEEFTIVRNADGGFTMTTIASGGRQMRSVLTTDPRGNPTAYEHHGSGGESIEKTITSSRDAGGVLVLSETSMRNPPFAPFRVPADTLLFGDGGIAQYWFLGLGPIPRDVSHFQTGRWSTAVARLSDAGPDSVTIEGHPVSASHLVLGEGSMRREVWVDARHRLLKVAVGSSTVAVRAALPK